MLSVKIVLIILILRKEAMLKFMLIGSCEECDMRCYGGTDENPACICGLLGVKIDEYWRKVPAEFHPDCPLTTFPKEFESLKIMKDDIRIDLTSPRQVETFHEEGGHVSKSEIVKSITIKKDAYYERKNNV